jgi:dTDP-glucose 4,6-dehydratase
MLLVTGGCGFIGSAFVLRWLAAHDEPLVNLDALTYAGHEANLADAAGDRRHTFCRGDVADAELVGRLLAQHRPRAVVHIAAETHVDVSIRAPERMAQSNTIGTLRLLEAVRAYWQALPPAERAAFRFLHVSTDEVYGALSPGEPPFHEGTPFAPNNPYSASKAAADHFVRAYHRTYGLPTLATHCSNNYGPRQFPEKLIPHMIHQALAGAPLPVYGDGLQVRDWLHVDDHVDALVRVLEGGRPGESYNVGDDGERNNLWVVRELCRWLDAWRPRADGVGYAAQITHVADRPGHDRRYAIDSRKLRRELDWAPRHTLNSGLPETVRWYLDHEPWREQVLREAAERLAAIGR